MHVPVVTRFSAVCVAAAAMAASPSASAHYYAELITNPIYGAADDGDAVSIRTDQLHSTCNFFTRQFVNHEMWYAIDTSGNYWVEVGFKDGEDGGGGCQTTIDFWADSRTGGGGYHEHYPGNSWSFGSWYQAVITSAGSCSWNVWLGGINVGTSTANCPGSGRMLAAGIESTSQTIGNAKGFIQSWYEQNSSGVWTQAWDNGYLSWNGQPFIQCLNNCSEMEEVLNESF